MSSYNYGSVQKHFQELRVDSGRRKSLDPFATGFEDDRGSKSRRPRSTSKPQAPAAEKPVAPARTSVASPFAAIDALRDSDDEFLDLSSKRTNRRPSPAPPQLPASSVTPFAAGRRGSVDKGLLPNPSAQAKRAAVAQAAGSLAYLDDSEEEDEDEDEEALPRPYLADRYPSPAPRNRRHPSDPARRSSTPKGSREPPKEHLPIQPSRHTVASPFAGTKYLEDSESDGDDDDDDAVTSRSNSVEDGSVDASATANTSVDKSSLEVQRVDKPKQNGSGVSWRAFSAGRAEQRSSEIEALAARLRQRGKSISFGTHALTDDGDRIPIVLKPDQIFDTVTGGEGARGQRGRTANRGKSPPRRTADTDAAEDEIADGGFDGIYDPREFQIDPFTDLHGRAQDDPFDGPLPGQQGMSTRTEVAFTRMTSPTSTSTMSTHESNASPDSPTDTSALTDSIGSLSSKVAVSPPQAIPEGQTVDLLLSPIMSPAGETTDPISRNSSTRSMRTASSRPRRIPEPGSRRSSRRSTSANTSISPAHAFLSSWANQQAASQEPIAEPKPDDKGQAFGLDNEYIIGDLINQGGFGVVKEAHTIDASGERITRAVKIVRKVIPGKEEGENDIAQQELEHEVSVWRHLKHRHILNLLAVYDHDFATFCVMDLNVGGTLFDLVRSSRGLSNDSTAPVKGRGVGAALAKSYSYQLASALRYLHEDMRVCHRDVKLENCLVDLSCVTSPERQPGLLRLCDFGLADFLHSDQSTDDALTLSTVPATATNPSSTTSSVIGTLEYASPRGLAANRKLYETAGDMWAYGVIVYALVTGDLPFRHPMPAKTVELILQAEWDEGPLLDRGADDRSEEEQLRRTEVKDKWWGGVRELVQGCLERDIDLRLTIGEVVRSECFRGCGEEDAEEAAGLGGGEGRGGWR